MDASQEVFVSNPLDLISSLQGIWRWENKLNGRWPKEATRQINPKDRTSAR